MTDVVKTADTTQTADETDIVPFVTGQLDTTTEGYAVISEQVQRTVDYNNAEYVPVAGIEISDPEVEDEADAVDDAANVDTVDGTDDTDAPVIPVVPEDVNVPNDLPVVPPVD